MTDRTAEEKLGYPYSERTRFEVRVEINEDLSGASTPKWIRGCQTLREAQERYLALRDQLQGEFFTRQMGFGFVFDEAGQEIASISSNGRLWAPSADGQSPWRIGVEPVAEAPEKEPCEESPSP